MAAKIRTTRPKRISRGKNTIDGVRIDGKLCCPHCRTIAGDNQEYDYNEATAEMIFFYACGECGKSFRCAKSIQDLTIPSLRGEK